MDRTKKTVILFVIISLTIGLFVAWYSQKPKPPVKPTFEILKDEPQPIYTSPPFDESGIPNSAKM